MAAPPIFEEGKSTYRPPRFNGQYYGWWKIRMHDFIIAEDPELWDVICDSPYIPTKAVGDLPLTMPKTRKEYTDVEIKVVENNFHARKFLVCGIGPEEYNRIFGCETAKEIWEALQTTHEGTTQVKKSKIDMLITEYEVFRMNDDESIQDIHTRFTSIINELHSLGEIIPRNKLVRKILNILPSSWESKVNAITEAKDLQELTIDELVSKDGQKKWRNTEKGQLQPKKYDLCHKCGKLGHFIKDYPLLKQEHSKYNPDKATKRNLVPDKHFKRKRSADNVVKQALAAWGDSSRESEDETDAGDSSMMAVESEKNEYDSIFSLMAQSDDDKDDDNSEETICELEKGKFVLTEKIANIEHERDDLVVVVVDHKETIKNFSKEKKALVKRVTNIEEERNDLLVVVADLREPIKGLGTESKPGNSGKGKEVAREAHISLENELKAVRNSLCVEIEKNKHLQTELERVKNYLKKSLKWTWPSEAIIAMHINNGGNRQGIGFQREKTPYNPHSKYVTVLDNWPCTHCENNDHFKENYQARVQSIQKNKVFAKNGTMKGSSRQWFMDSGYSKHMTGNTMDFLSLKALQGGSISFGNGKKGTFLELENLLSVSQICDKGNKVEFLSEICTITNLVTSKVVLVAKRYKNIYVADFESIQSGDLSCLKYIDDDAELWHRRLGKDQLGKFDANSDEGIFLEYSSQSKAYKIYNKQTQCVEKSVHVIFDKSYPSCEKSTKDDQDGEPLLIPGEVIDMTNGKTDIISQVKEPSGDNADSSSREPGTSITTEAEETVVDTV
ncbi:uncharacterized protein [Nicotiana sylvestris]|uniref:uncharacterized protein n=1 Tax=Nicotiana sylvestris TaxID=4096 RepID=UPI00388CD32E